MFLAVFGFAGTSFMRKYFIFSKQLFFKAFKADNSKDAINHKI